MSKCLYCRARKGKRPCPGLGGVICSQCCGEHRRVRIACPSDCVFLEPNSEYQQKRVGDRFAQARRDFYSGLFDLGGERAAALFNLIEVVTFSYFQSRRDGQDGEVISAIQSLRRTLSPLHIPAAPAPVFAEHLRKEYEAFAKPQAGTTHPVIDQQAATEVLDRALTFASGFSGPGLQSQRFLTGLIGYIKAHHPAVAEQLAAQGSDGGRIVLPGQFAPGPLPPAPGAIPGHLHHAQAHAHPHTHRH